MKLDIDTRIKPSHGIGTPVAASDPGDYYPEFTFRYDEEDAVPDVGTMVIKYRVSRRDEDAKRDPDQRYSCTIEVLGIESAKSAEPKSPTSKHNEAGDALDKLAAEKSDENDDKE